MLSISSFDCAQDDGLYSCAPLTLASRAPELPALAESFSFFLPKTPLVAIRQTAGTFATQYAFWKKSPKNLSAIASYR